MEAEKEYTPMQQLKRAMYAMRNGIVADALRKGGSPYRLIFGVNLPQLAEIAAMHGQDAEMAELLWADAGTRESMLLAPMLMPADKFSIDDAMRWISTAVANEAVDVLCLKLLRHQPYALDLAQQLLDNGEDLSRYAGLRLMCNLAPRYPRLAVEIGQKEKARGDRAALGMAEILLSYQDML